MQKTILEKKLGKIAIVCDQMTSLGGAEREMFSMMKLFPSADIFTMMYFKEKFPDNRYNIKTSFVQKLPFKRLFQTHVKILTPLAYETLDLSGYDFVISISAGPAKSIITNIDQTHVAMVMTPPRSLWENEESAKRPFWSFLYMPLAYMTNSYFKLWDYTSSKRVDYWTANSEYVKKKIKKIYGTDAEVIYPGVGEIWFKKPEEILVRKMKAKFHLPRHFALVVSRLYKHKRIEWAINSCRDSNTPLYIIGEGPDRRYFERFSKGNENIHFLGKLSDEEVIAMYNIADVVLFSSIEDFGLVPVEAMAGGTPVFAYGVGGVRETVKEGITGEIFYSNEELTELLKKFRVNRYNSNTIRKRAMKFSEEKFHKNLIKFLIRIHEKEAKRS